MSAITDLLGQLVVNKVKDRVDTSRLSGDGKVVGLYFSAHWCPPCRAFTPELAQFYRNFKEGPNGSKLEIVFVSSDRDEESFNEYLDEMPWFALPFSDRDRKIKLSKRFKVQGIPTLVFLDASNGSMITTNGREKVTSDPNGLDFPWHPKPLSEILQGSLLKGTEEVEADSALKDKIKGLYFSAHWCPPCRVFTPELIKCYNTLKDQGRNFEIVFVSSDRMEDSFKEYYGTMPWLSMPFEDKRVAQLKGHFNVEGIPTLIIVDEKNETVTKNGRQVVMKDPEGKEFPWPPKPLEPLDGSTAAAINETAALILFGEAEKDETPEQWAEKARSWMEEPAAQYRADYLASRGTAKELPELNFFYEIEEENEISESLRMYAQLGDAKPLLVLLDIPERRIYVTEGNITKETVQKTLSDFKTEKLPFVQLRV